MGRGAFRIQLFVTMAAIVLVVTAAMIVVTSFVARAQTYEVSRELVAGRIDQYAKRAIFATLVGREDPTVVRELLGEISGLDSVLGVELLDGRGAQLGIAGEQPSLLQACRFTMARASKVYERNEVWCAHAVVRREAEHGARNEKNQGGFGELRVASSMERIQQRMRRLLIWNLVASTVVLTLGVFLVWRGAQRLTDPLDRLADVMRHLREGEAQTRAALEGPDEVVAISRVFNELLEKLAQEAASLERKVEERTRELQAAWQAASGAERYKSVFMATVTHEMRTPLHVIQSHGMDTLNELEFLDGSHDARGHVSVILRESAELLERLNQILDLARAEAGHHVIDFIEFDLMDFGASISERNIPLARQFANELRIDAEALRIVTDRDKLLQIVGNLVTNACKFTNKGHVNASLRVFGEELQITVQDTGRGIAADAQQMVWREFTQAHCGDVRRPAGFGLGLAIVRRFTEILGGRVDLVSQQGVGTTVYARIPVKVVGSKEAERVVV